MTGFAQMATGAAATQLVTLTLDRAATAIPMSLMMLLEVLATALAFRLLARR